MRTSTLRIDTVCYFTALFLTAILTCSPAVCSQRPEEAAFGVPVSDRVIEGEISFAQGEPFFFKVREGMMLTTRETGGHAYGFVPLIQKTGDVEFAVYELTPAAVGERATEIGLLMVNGNGQAPAAAPTAEPIDLLVYRISKANFEEEAVTDPSSEDPEDLRSEFELPSTCCVTCNGRTVCACEVVTGCGSCCAPACCSGGGKNPRLEPSQDPLQ